MPFSKETIIKAFALALTCIVVFSSISGSAEANGALRKVQAAELMSEADALVQMLPELRGDDVHTVLRGAHMAMLKHAELNHLYDLEQVLANSSEPAVTQLVRAKITSLLLSLTQGCIFDITALKINPRNMNGAAGAAKLISLRHKMVEICGTIRRPEVPRK